MSEHEGVPAWASDHPVSSVRWTPIGSVRSNSYNPNSVAPPEMKLLRLSIEADGFTQPVVCWDCGDGIFEVVDGFHRYRVALLLKMSHLPIVVVNADRTDRGDRMASTVRHNRARGRHGVEAMSAIVVELKRRKWSDEKIAKELGMDADEVLRLAQVAGIAALYADREFSKAWEQDA